MKAVNAIFCGLLFFFFSSFASPNEACSYASSNLNYIKTLAKKAIADDDLNKSKYYTYKAIKVIQTSTSQFEDCGCKNAESSIKESASYLKSASKATSVSGSRLLLNKAITHISSSIKLLEKHNAHTLVPVSSAIFKIEDTSKVVEKQISEEEANKQKLYEKIDIALISYTTSINKVIESVNCSEAHDFAENIYLNCEQELLNPDLSEGKKYYNLRTKEITKEAIATLGDCGD